MTSTTWQRAWPWLLLLLVALFTAWLRYGVIEPATMAQQCGGGHAPWWCRWRQWLVLGFLHDVYGIAALLATALALFWKRMGLAWLAAALGIIALQLYCFESGALAVLIGCLRLLRLQATRAPPVDQHRHGQQQVHSQP
ncbi:hypothetical protein ASG75_14440 [Rhodanobacter sp. Soil772]|uniref:hypothetical protein n=1 Tax=Rhodanobacter sp. Soil772 TaxID=1736406 RepID=UPI0006FEAFFD|nr:hypothetical protein [Rhodanobacter sp. Soil772]KRE83561.1 hypothetical protein ASG75_14440 [Rhodanobacter sp. Soil772]